MLMTKRLEVLIFIILITVVSCIDNTDKRAADVIFDADRDADIFYENIEKIVLKRFVLDSTVVFGNEPEFLYDGDIFVADKKRKRKNLPVRQQRDISQHDRRKGKRG